MGDYTRREILALTGYKCNFELRSFGTKASGLIGGFSVWGMIIILNEATNCFRIHVYLNEIKTIPEYDKVRNKRLTRLLL